MAWTRRHFLKSAVGLAASGMVGGVWDPRVLAQAAQGGQRPNILFILADDLGWGDPGCYPSLRPEDGPEAIVETPHIDRLASSGVRFTNGYANHMVCAPTRAGLLTGRYQHRFGYYGFGETMAPFPKVVMLPEPLRAAGYATGMMGKWHISYSPGSRPLDRGFERFFGFLGGQHDYFDPDVGQPTHQVPNARDAYIYDQNTRVKEMPYLTDELTTRSMDFMDSAVNAKRSFFLYLSYNAPHSPLQVPWEDLEPLAKARGGNFTSRDIARAMIKRLDANVGRLIEHLRKKGLIENTLIIFSSDNGAAPHCYAGGFRGRKGYFYEGGIRVPMIISWPGQIPANQVLDEPVITHDIFPTALAAAGIEKMPEGVEGVNWLPYVTGKVAKLPRHRLFWGLEDIGKKWAVREGRWKLVREDANDWFGTWPVKEPPKKQWPRPDWRIQLFDLEDDPREQHDLSQEHPEIVARLKRAIEEFYAANAPSIYTAEVRARNHALQAERAANPDKYPVAHPGAGSPGHWRGKTDSSAQVDD